MSNEQELKEVPLAVILAALEGAVKWLKEQGESDTDIHKWIHLMYYGHWDKGNYTEEYIRAVAEMEAEKSKSNIILP